jgi:hypothetical protein
MIRRGYVVRESYRECDLSPCYYGTTAWFHLGNGSTQSNSKGGPCLQKYLSHVNLNANAVHYSPDHEPGQKAMKQQYFPKSGDR